MTNRFGIRCHNISNSIKTTIFGLFTIMLISCDETTGELGTSLTSNMNNVQITTDTFFVKSETFCPIAVYARSNNGYLGRVIDPETGTYVTANYMTQFHTLEDYHFPDSAEIVSKLADGTIYADSCELRLFYQNTFGDSLSIMKLNVIEMENPMSEDIYYYTDFNLEDDGGLLRTNGINKTKTYSLTYSTDSVTPNIRIELNDPYTSKAGKTYNNYGTYLLDSYYSRPQNYSNSFQFTKNVVPGFYFKHNAGLGSMAEVFLTQLVVYFRYCENDSIYTGYSAFAGTEEVLKTTTIINDTTTLKSFEDDYTCTYLKTPAGLFTELKLPVDEIYSGHQDDSVSLAKIVLPRLNNNVNSEYAMKTPQYLLMLPVDSLQTFFEKGKLADNRIAHIAAYSNAMNTYSFNNISNLITYMNEHRNSANWNKVAIVPITATSNSSGVLLNVAHNMEMTSCKLVRGFSKEELEVAEANGITLSSHAPLTISVIYSKFQ